MTTILRQGPTCDGYDVRILIDGEALVVHFRTKPTDVEAAVAAFVADREAAKVTYTIYGESDA